MFHEYLQGSLEALLFAAGEPLTVAQIAGIMQLDKPQVWELLTMLEESYNEETAVYACAKWRAAISCAPSPSIMPF